MPHEPVAPLLRTNARRMRRQMTEAELKLWNEIRAHRLMGLKFRRQMPIAGYIVDFACPARRLIIEVDGIAHAETRQADYDRRRSDTLRQSGWRVLRFWNHEVIEDIDGVCCHILVHLRASGDHPHA